MKRKHGLVIGVLLVFAAFYGCSANPGAQKHDAAQELTQMKDTVVAARSQVDRTLGSLHSLLAAAPQQLPQAYSRFSQEVDRLDRQVAAVQEHSQDVNAKSDKWLSSWRQSYDRIEDPELKSLSEEQRAAVVSRFDRINQSSRAARDALIPLMKDLRDVKTVVGNDLNPRVVEQVASTEVVRNADMNGQVATRNMDVAISDYLALTNTLSTTR